jgi:hypothetical protein
MKRLPVRALCALFILSIPASSGAAEAEKLQVSMLGDTEKSCGELSQEAARMNEIIYNTEDFKKDSSMKSHGISAAGAVGSFLIGTVTGGIGIAAGALLLDNQVGAQAETADTVQDIAEQRRSLMQGIYNAKGCEGPMEAAMPYPKQKPVKEASAYNAVLEPAGGTEKPARPAHPHERPTYNN